MEVTCAMCGKVEDVIPSRAKRYKTCSRECLGKLNSLNTSQKVTIACEWCGRPYQVKPSHADGSRCCSRKCLNEWKTEAYIGEGNPNFGNTGSKSTRWAGGRRMSNYGYVLIHMPDHSMARPDGYILEHRYVMSEKLGRLLDREEIVHHIDGNRTNNDPNNLELTTQAEHTAIHHKLRREVK